jgi:hypothetical protein
MARMNMVQALNSAMDVMMARDDNVVVFGEDVGYFGGVFRCTEGLQRKYGPDRAFDTPIAEAGILATAVGMGVYGLRPVVEIQFADYIYPATDQLISSAARLRYRSAGEFTAPITVRTPCGGGIFGGQTHSQSPEAIFTHVCGLKTVIPSNPYDAKGLLISAIEDDDPVIFLEPNSSHEPRIYPRRNKYHRLACSRSGVAFAHQGLEIVAAQSVRLQPLLQQLHQCCCRFCLPFGWDVLSERVGRALDQHAQDYIRVHLALANHADHLSKDVHWVRSIGGGALHAADQLIHGSERAVWHSASMTSRMAIMQAFREAQAMIRRWISANIDRPILTTPAGLTLNRRAVGRMPIPWTSL